MQVLIMKIDLIKSYLRHIVLLAKEYKEITNENEREDIKRIQSTIHDEREVSKYDRDFLNAVNGTKNRILTQIDFFTKKLVCEFALPEQMVIDIDPNIVKIAKIGLSNSELNLLIAVLKFQVLQQHLEKNTNGEYRLVPLEEIVPKLDKFVDYASIDC